MSDRAALLLIAVLSLIVAACESMETIGNPLSNPLDAITGTWDVERIGGVDVASMLPAGMPGPSLTIEADGSVNGFAGVNRLSSSLDLEALAAGQFSLSPVATTRMAGPPEAMNVEATLLQRSEKRLDSTSMATRCTSAGRMTPCFSFAVTAMRED